MPTDEGYGEDFLWCKINRLAGDPFGMVFDSGLKCQKFDENGVKFLTKCQSFDVAEASLDSE